MKAKSSTRQSIRWLSFLLAIILTLGCIPAPAYAAEGGTPETLTVGKIDILGTYKSDYLDTVTLRHIPVTLAGDSNSYIGFCYAHGAGLSLNGLPNKWTYSDTLLPSETAAAPFLSWYAYHMSVGTWGGDSWTETSAATWVQAAVWLAQAGVLTDYNNAGQLAILAAEREKATSGYASTEESVVLFQQIVNGYKANAYGTFIFNIYSHESATIQPILVPYSKPNNTDNPVYVKIQKTIENGSIYSSNATFGIYANPNCTIQLATFNTSGQQWSVSGEIKLGDATTATLYIKEISSGSSEYAVNPTVYSVAVDSAIHNTPEKAAAVSTTIVNTKLTPPSSSSVIQKADGATGAGIGPATFTLEGDAADGSYIKKSVTTDAAGSITLQWLNPSSANYIKPGYYMVTEETAPAGYEKSEQSQYLKLWLEYDRENDVYIPLHSGPIVFENYAQHSIVFSKVSPSGKGLAGGSFDVYHNGKLVHAGVKTSSSGTIALNNIASGTWMFVEKAAPDGYLTSALSASASVYVDAARTDITSHHISMTNYEYPDIVIEKYSAGNQALAGGVFEVTIDGTTLGTFQTNQAGVIDITHAQYGAFLNPANSSWTVRCEEVQAPEGYFIAEQSWQENEIRKGQALSSFVFVNESYPSIEIVKQSTAGEFLPDALFEVAIDAAPMGTFTTDETGRIRISYAVYGGYLDERNETWAVRVEEVKPPDGYLGATPAYQENQMKKGQDLSPFVFVNERKPNLEILKYGTTEADGDVLLSGVTYRVWQQGNETAYRDVKTDSKGRIYLEALEPGYWRLQEIATVSPYQLDDTVHTMELVAGQTATHTAVNHRRPNLTVVKTCSVTGNPLSNAKFQIFSYAADGSETDLGVFYTNDRGEIRLEALDPTRIKIVELEPKAGYAIPTGSETQEVYLKLDEDKTVTFENVPLSAIVIHKTDTAAPSNPLEGAEFELRYLGGDTSGTGGITIGSYTTSESGSVVITGLERGYYIIEEKVPPANHSLSSETTQTVFVSGYDQDVITVTFRNQRNPGFLLIKRDAQDKAAPLSGAVYKITDSSGAVLGDNNGLFTTGADGTIYIPNLTPSMTLLVQEVTAPKGYQLDPTVYTAKLDGAGDYELELYNTKLNQFILTKLDAYDSSPLKGVEYYITFADGTTVQGGSNGYFYTDEAGRITITDLPAGTVLKIKETKTSSDRYILDTTVYTYTIAQGTNAKTFTNERKGGILLMKRDAQDNHLLSGVQFKFTYANGQVVGSANGIYTTDSSGQIRIPEQFAPNTVIKAIEVKAKSGYQRNDIVYTFVIEDSDTMYIQTAYNEPIGGVELIKVDADSNSTRIADIEFELRHMNGGYIGAYTTDRNGKISVSLEDGWYTFTEISTGKTDYILDQTPINFEVRNGEITTLRVKNAKASRILIHKVDLLTGAGIAGVKFLLMDKNKNPLMLLVTDQDGYCYVDASDELTEGKYFLREYEAAAGYILDEQIKSVYLEAGKTTTVEWQNTPERGQIIVTKKSAAFNEVTGLPAGSLLSDSVFEVYSVTGNLVDRMTSNTSGIAASSLLPLGVYVVKEVSPSPYYALNTREFLADLRHHGDVVRFEVFNENVTLGVTLQKKSANAANNGQQLYYDLFGIANTSSVALENFYVHDRLPTDAVRGVTVWTGTWSHRLNYQVTYKTNYSDYRVLAGGLSTQTNYELSIHPNVLGLQSGEYVTDIRFEFGTVPAGFACAANPKLQTQVLSTLPKGYRIVNRADAGGFYFGTWQTAQTSWTTLVYDDPAPAPELPKTGF